MATMKSAQTVYEGPSTSYHQVGSVSAGETISLKWKEMNGSTTWAYIEYDVTGKGLKKCGYVLYSSVNGTTSVTFAPTMGTRYVRKGCIPFYGPSNRGYSPVVDTYGISRGETIKYTGKKDGDYAFMEYGSNRRFWVLASNMSDSFPTGADATSLDFPYNFCQTDPAWKDLNDEFPGRGCAVCCAADVASYVEGKSLDPAKMKNLGVFTGDNILCNWSRASTKCTWEQTITPSSSEYFKRIIHHINSGLPVILLLKRSSDGGTHWVVAYGYRNGGESASDILVRDPWDSSVAYLDKTLSDHNYACSGLKHVYMK